MTSRLDLQARISTHKGRSGGLVSIETQVPEVLPAMDNGSRLVISGARYQLVPCKPPYRPGDKLFMLRPTTERPFSTVQPRQPSAPGCDIEFGANRTPEVAEMVAALNMLENGDEGCFFGKTQVKALVHPGQGTMHFYLHFIRLL